MRLEEEWRAIPGFEGRYEVSNQGRVRSVPRPISYPKADGTVSKSHTRPGKLLRPGLTSAKYLSVSLGGDTHLVHRLVARAFAGECPDGQEVCHNNGNRIDNRSANLRYGTRKENVADTKKHGRQVKHFRLKPCQELLVAVRYHHGGERAHELAKEFGINFNTVYNIKRRFYGK